MVERFGYFFNYEKGELRLFQLKEAKESDSFLEYQKPRLPTKFTAMTEPRCMIHASLILSWSLSRSVSWCEDGGPSYTVSP